MACQATSARRASSKNSTGWTVTPNSTAITVMTMATMRSYSMPLSYPYAAFAHAIHNTSRLTRGGEHRDQTRDGLGPIFDGIGLNITVLSYMDALGLASLEIGR